MMLALREPVPKESTNNANKLFHSVIVFTYTTLLP